MESLTRDLRKRVAGEVRFDKMTKVLYSTDASIYEIEPLGVVVPQAADDVLATVELCRHYGVPILPRGAGTALSGQSVGRAVILDMSKFLNRVLEVNLEERWARVQPGVVLDELNAELRPHGLWFAPDPSPSNRATLGGMMGNNSSGARSIVYGRTVEHVREMTVALADGQVITARDLTPAELERTCARDSLEGQALRTLTAVIGAQREEIQRRYPKILRRVGGYALDEFVGGRPFNLSRLLVGSEGTLATTVEARINLVPRPGPHQVALMVVQYRSMFEALASAQEILTTNPSGVELVDRYVLDLTRASIEYARQLDFVQGDPEALLLVEYQGESRAELAAKLDRLEARLKRLRIGTAYTRAMEPAEQQRIWKVRNVGMALLLGMPGDAKPVAGIEDTAVAPERLAEYVRRLDELIRRHGARAAYYGHASVGCLHVRPIIDLKQGLEVEKLRAIAEKTVELVLEFGGAMSAEHGDGLSRSCWNERIFGPTLYQAFREVKRAFDPQGIMNPGKIVDAPAMTENLRFGAAYKARQIQTFLSFKREGGFDRAIEQCNGAGVCKKKLEGTMCPSYMVTREEEHSTRGRANALRAAINGNLPEDALTSERMYEVFDLCLECKGCKAECPSNVDMAKLKYEFLAQYYAKHGTPLRARLFGNVEGLNRLGCAFAPVSTWIAGSAPSRWVMDRFFGIHRKRTLPPFARETFPAWFSKRNGGRPQAPRGQVVLLDDTYMRYNYPQIGKAAVKVLEAAGFEVILAERKCCGRPLISKGLIRQAKANAAHNIEKLCPYIQQGIPLVGVEPSCVLTFRDEYPSLVDEPRAERLAKHVLMIEEFLVRLHDTGRLSLPLTGAVKSILLHGHCHQKALIGSSPSLQILRLIPGAAVEEVDSGCCGMAGSFGYEKEHYDLSIAIGERRLFPAVRRTGDDCTIVAAGVSCRQQIAHGTGRRAKHLVEVLAEALP
ncbi:MAG: anaerobic glycerol-3-phosphate dehydrogenase subunit C [candidate division NC10 bacterium]|nr:anaerobic glycerol-3-phosphate dehydrogenase subunit C [candidate division NC10 bacterium]